MSTWVIGDIHGCWEPLERLLESIRFNADRDRLWLVGDLVNRGPDSVRVLRWASSLGDRITAVLGNHDLKLLACAEGINPVRDKDTFGDVLAAPDREELIAWLASRPLLVREGAHVLIHAGILPAWSIAEAERLAGEVAAELAGAGRTELLARPGWWHPVAMPSGGARLDRLAAAAGIFTGVRVVAGRDRPPSEFAGRPEQAPPGFRPWYEGARVADEGLTVLFGHWAAHGLARLPGAVCLDTACVYGGALTALRLEDAQLVQVLGTRP